MGYHKRKIKRGEFGKFSKIAEEFEELLDANEQGVRVMELVELSDLYGAIEAYLQNEYNMEIDDIKKMSELTKKAFQDGSRS